MNVLAEFYGLIFFSAIFIVAAARVVVALAHQRGLMHRFVTCTTFTTWHRNFRWDSLHP